MQDTKNQSFTFTRAVRQVAHQGGFMDDPAGVQAISNISPGWRGVVAHADVAQTVWSILSDVYGTEGLVVKHAMRTDNEMRLRVLTPYDEPVRPNGRAIGDVLRLGIETRYQAGMELHTSLFAERLVCLNGMTASKSMFDWGARAVGRPEDQLQWLTIGVTNAILEFDKIVERAKEMAGTAVGGDPEDALIERARAMRLPPRFDERLIDAFRQEPGDSEWDLLNAFTRLATHGGIPMTNADAVMAAAGGWAAQFDMVTARMPRPLAMQVGARIIGGAEGEVIDG